MAAATLHFTTSKFSQHFVGNDGTVRSDARDPNFVVVILCNGTGYMRSMTIVVSCFGLRGNKNPSLMFLL